VTTSGPAPEPPPVERPPCYAHPDRVAAVQCARCLRPICTDCMVQAAVGWQCPACVKDGAKRSRQVPAFTHTSRGRSGVVGSTNPTPIVLAIIAVNIFVFLVLERTGNNVGFISRYALSPADVHVQGQYYRAFTAMWMHANFQHILFNMLALLIVGPAVEVLLGKVRFLALYLLAGLGGSVGSYLLSTPYGLGVGASGAIMGVMGAYVVIGLRRRLPVGPVVALLAINFVVGFWGNIDWRAHLGGFVTGCVLAFLYDYAGTLRDRRTELALTIGGTVALAALLALLITSIAPGHVNFG